MSTYMLFIPRSNDLAVSCLLDEARQIMSEEQSELGHRPPPGSLAAEAQSAAQFHPEGEPGVPHPDPTTLSEAVREDAQRVVCV